MSRRTIQSPGVEIREIDLTQRPAAPVGTSVFIAGFANQGPVDEIFNVGTFAEFEEIMTQTPLEGPQAQQKLSLK